MPFIDAPPGDLNTIYTAIVSAVERCKEMGLDYTFINFDQPLLWKGQKVLSERPEDELLKKVVLRSSSIGYIHSNTGLYDLFYEVYGPNTAKRMMEDHDYAKCSRALDMVHLALGKIILSETKFTKEDKKVFADILKDIGNDTTLEKLDSCYFDYLRKQFDDTFNELRKRDPTAQLWAQLFDLISIAKNFIDAERCGEFQRHLDSVQQMIPIFHASGHYLYAQ